MRRWLWSWAALLAVGIVLGRLLGGWPEGWDAAAQVTIVLTATAFASLLVAGLIELRAGRRDRDG
jgi:hypothetical protein